MGGDSLDVVRSDGRRLVAIAIWALLCASILVIVASMFVRHSGPRLSEVVRLALEVLLCVFLYRGAAWARWLTIVCFGLGALFAFRGGLGLLPQAGGLLLLFLAVTFAACAMLLAFPRSVRSHFAQANQDAG